MEFPGSFPDYTIFICKFKIDESFFFIQGTFLVYKLETFKNCKEVNHIMIMIVTYIFFILCGIWSPVENYFQKILSPHPLKNPFPPFYSPHPPFKSASPLFFDNTPFFQSLINWNSISSMKICVSVLLHEQPNNDPRK